MIRQLLETETTTIFMLLIGSQKREKTKITNSHDMSFLTLKSDS